MHSLFASEDMIAVSFPTMLCNFNYQKSTTVGETMSSLSETTHSTWLAILQL